ncbi:HipA family kinase [Halalkalibacter okhensis]|uniref:HipA-like kinase domain-containing protein n=1 Tax=Halalkalibacter okhensis TaxID=333138 RepID=A0A0B0ILR2_9BACI|nr:HipA family kinase [Halalkalibacter okhensis]KHF40606.1 hypothetical protein LQ50_08810 [Halalkalibacter okhensis]
MITPIQHVKKLENNTKNVHVLTFNDQKEYLVKFHVFHHQKALVNEWLSYCLARYLQLPVPPAEIVEIPRELYETIPDFLHVPYVSHHLAFTDQVNQERQRKVSEMINQEHIAAIIVLDYWLCNSNRTQNNIFLGEMSENQYDLSILESPTCFGSTSWTITDLQKLPERVFDSSTHRILARFIKSEQEFREQLKIIQQIPMLLIDEILSFIPDCWHLTKEERKEIVRTLRHRKYKVLPKVLDKFISNVYLPEIDRV